MADPISYDYEPNLHTYCLFVLGTCSCVAIGYLKDMANVRPGQRWYPFQMKT